MAVPYQQFHGVTKLGIDTAPIIYFIEANPTYDTPTRAIFQAISTGAVHGISSVVTICEVLSLPLQQGNLVLAEQYRGLLLNSEYFSCVLIDAGIAEMAALLRAKYQLRTPDAIQIATAVSTGCEAFLTNDAKLKRVTELQVILVDELLR